MKSNVGGIRLKLSTTVNSRRAAQLPRDEEEAGHVAARVLATTIATHTINVLLKGEMLDPVSASDQLRNYGSMLDNELNGDQCVLHFLFPDEGRLAMVLGWLNSQANLHVWEIAHRIPPPEPFYKAHPRILEACKLCGAVILDASSPSTVTTGSINPLTGGFLARWIQTDIEYHPAETRPRFFFPSVL